MLLNLCGTDKEPNFDIQKKSVLTEDHLDIIMKKIVRLTESDLVRIVKRVIEENEINEIDYTTKYNHSLTDKYGKKYSVIKNSVWKEKNINGEKFWVNSKNGLYFNCNGKNHPETEEEELYTPMNILKMNGSQSLTSTMKTELCKKM